MVALTVSCVCVCKSETESENNTNTFILPSLTPIPASLSSFPCLISVQTVSAFTRLFVFFTHCTLLYLHSLHKSSSGMCVDGWVTQCRLNLFILYCFLRDCRFLQSEKESLNYVKCVFLFEIVEIFSNFWSVSL